MHISLWFAGATLLGLGYGLAHVRADGAPKNQPLWYAGTVADAAGAPLEGNHSVTLRLFSAASGGSAACTAGPVNLAFQKGRFRLDASAAPCMTTIAATPDLFAELSVDDKAFPRSKIGAVPFAMDAQRASAAATAKLAERATVADTAGSATSAVGVVADGALDQRLKNLETAVAGLQEGVGGTNYVRLGKNQIAWGTIMAGSGSYVDVTFPKAFASADIHVVATARGAGQTQGTAMMSPASLVSAQKVTLQWLPVNGFPQPATSFIDWVAIGPSQ
jgi:hypothetical protein